MDNFSVYFGTHRKMPKMMTLLITDVIFLRRKGLALQDMQ